MRESRSLRYMLLVEELLAEIGSGRYKAAGFLPAERDIAALHGVSRTTVRAALRHLEIQRIIRAEHGRGHRILVGARPNTEPLRAIALIMPFVTASTMHQIVRGCARALEDEGYDVVTMDTTAETSAGMRRRERSAVESLLRKAMHGAVWWPSFPEDHAEIAARVADSGIPVVTVDRTLPGLPFDHVGVDNVRAAYEATEHLITEGHTRIGHVTQEAAASTVSDRRKGYERALRDHGLPVLAGDVVVWKPSVAERARLCHRLLSSQDRPTALFCVNDYIAVELLLMLQDFGSRIPQDMAIVGFDNAHESTLVRPPLTTVAQPLTAIGETAARLLLTRRSGTASGPGQNVLLGTNLIIRESSVG